MRAQYLLGILATGCGRLSFEVADARAGDVGDVDGTTDGSDGVRMPGCVDGETPGPYRADFAQGVPTFGSIYQISPAQMDVFEEQLRGRPGMDSGNTVYAGFEIEVADYRARRAFVQVPKMVDTAGCAQVAFVIQDDDVVQYAELGQTCGTLEAQLFVGTTPTVLAQTPYDPVQHRWWQLRAQRGTLAFEVSADGIDWVTLATTPTPAYFDDSYVELSAGTYQLESAIGEARFDDLFDCLTP